MGISKYRFTFDFDKENHSNFFHRIKSIISNSDESVISMRIESTTFHYFNSFFDAIRQADLLDINCLDETEKFKKGFDDIYLLWAKHCGFWRSSRIINIVGLYEQTHGFDRFFPKPRFSRTESFKNMLKFALADYIKRYKKQYK